MNNQPKESMRFTRLTIWFAFILAYSVPFLAFNKLLPNSARHLTDLGAIFIFIALVAEAVRTRQFFLPAKYTLFAIFLIMAITLSAIVSGQSLGSLLFGIKIYFVYIPYFLLPFAVRFTHGEVQGWLTFLLSIAILQLPLTLFQRFIQFGDRMHTGDYITGLMGISSFLSIFLICAIALVNAYYLHKKISLISLLVLTVVFFLPTTINETKGTLFLLPLALTVPALIYVLRSGSLAKFIPVALIGGLFFTAFVAIYNQFEQAVFDRTLAEKDLFEYTFRDREQFRDSSESPVAAQRKLNKTGETGRGDAILIPLEVLSSDGLLAFGKGLGNITHTTVPFFLGDGDKYEHLKPTYNVVSRVLWELGLIGVVLAFTIVGLVTADIWSLLQRTGFDAMIATGWLGVTAVLAASMVYKDLINANVLSAPFWLITGYLCSLQQSRPVSKI